MEKNLLETSSRKKENSIVTKGEFEGGKNSGKTYWRDSSTLGNLSSGIKGEY